MKILLTAFEPFGGDSVNASLEAVNRVNVPEAQITKLVLPVVFGKAGEAAVKKAEEIRPDWVVLTGQASGRKEISVEYGALNVRYAAIPDNEGNMPKFEKILADGENAAVTDLPFEDILRDLEKENVPAKISFTAGTFVCNDTFYLVQRMLKDTGTKTGFIHLPDIRDMDSTSAAKGLETVLHTLIYTYDTEGKE